MKKKSTVLAVILTVVLAFTCVVGFTACGEPEAAAILLKTAPTVTSQYNEALAIAGDGVIKVKYADDSVAEVAVTVEMIDQSGFDNKSLEEQTLKIKYGGKEVSFSFKLVREAASISIKTAPTVTSIYTGLPLKIGDDGILAVTYKDGGTADVKITEEMLDLTEFDMDSADEQNVKVNYGGESATFKVTLTYDPINDEGEIGTVRFEAEQAELGGGSVDVEDCGTEADGFMTRVDGSREQCVKNLFLGEGGYVTFRITSDKRTHARIRLSIGTASFASPYDDYARVAVNGELLTTGIVPDGNVEKYGMEPWWVFQNYEMTEDIILKRGVNEISVRTYEYADIVVAPGDAAPKAGGKNLNWIEFDTTGTLAWATEE